MVAVALVATALVVVGGHPTPSAAAPSQMAPPDLTAVPRAEPTATISPDIGRISELVHAPADERVWALGTSGVVLLIADVVVSRSVEGGRAAALSEDGQLLYVRVSETEIVALEPTTLLELHRLQLPAGTCMGDTLAPVGGRLWFAAGNCVPGSGIGLASVDPQLGTVPVFGPATWIGPPRVAALGADRLVVLGALPAPGGASDYRLYVDDVSTGTPQVLVSRSILRSNAEYSRLVSSPAGDAVILGAELLDAATLEPRLRFIGGGPRSFSPDGGFVAGLGYPYGSVATHEVVLTWAVGHETPLGGQAVARQLGGPIRNQATTAIVLGRGGRRAWVGIVNGVIDIYERRPPPARMELTVPRTSSSGSPITISGTLALPDGTAVDRLPVTVVRTSGGAPVVIGSVNPGADGSFEITDVAPPAGGVTYRTTWPGDIDHESAIALAPVQVGGPPLPPAPPLPSGRADVGVPLPGTRVMALVADDARRRVVALTGHSLREAPPASEPVARVVAYDFSGAELARLEFSSAVSEVVFTPDASHLLLAMPDVGRIGVVDADTFALVGSWPTDPLVSRPDDITLVGGRVWVREVTSRSYDSGLPYDSGEVAAFSSRAPADFDPYPLDGRSVDGFFSDDFPVAAPGDPPVGFSSYSSWIAGWDLAAQPPVVRSRDRHSYVDGFGPDILLPTRDGGAVLYVKRSVILTLDAETIALQASRGAGDTITSAALGPTGTSVIVVTSDTTQSWTPVPRPTESAISIFGDGQHPLRVIDLTGRMGTVVGATADGSAAFVAAKYPSGSPARYELRILHDPFVPFAHAVTDLAAAVRPAAVNVSWQPPIEAGRAPITGYTVRATRYTDVAATVRTGPDGRTARLEGLVPGATYEIEVTPHTDLGDGAKASVTATVQSWSPFPTAEAFVDRQYRELLGRPPDAGGLSYWAGQISSGAMPPAVMVEQFVRSPEFGGAIAPVTRLYLAAFDRYPDVGGLAYWVARVRAGASLVELGRAFAGAPEFRARYGAQANTAYVDGLYRRLLGRPADTAGRTYWVNALTRGASRGDLLASFAGSLEYGFRVQAFVDVGLVHLGLLRVPPGATLVDDIAVVVQGGVAALATQILESDAYAARVG